MVDIQMSMREVRRHQLLANIVFLTHVAFGLWLLVGWVFIDWRLLYIASLFVWIGSWVVLGFCPLTYIEFWLRRKVGKNLDLKEEFIHYYTRKFFRIDLPMSAIFVGGMITFGALICLSLMANPLG